MNVNIVKTDTVPIVVPSITDIAHQESFPVEQKKPKKEDSEPSSAHLLYAVEMLMFALVGWAWLAVREIMGGTPVLEVTVLLVMLVSSVLNLLFALIYYTTDQFKHPAQAFLNHTACVWVLYIFCQFQSSTDGRGPICCVEDGKKGLFSLRLTYKAAHFGGLALHQPAAAITLAFLSIFLILAASQARVCIENPGEWPMHKAPLAVVCLLCLQQGLFGVTAPVCKDQDVSAAVIGIVVFAWLTMIDVPWVLSFFSKTDNKKDDNKNSEDMVMTPDLLIKNLIQAGLEVVLSIMLGAMAAVLAVNLGGGDALLLVVGVTLLWQMAAIVTLAFELRNAYGGGSGGSGDSSGSGVAPKPQTLLQPYNYYTLNHNQLLLPEARDLRRASGKGMKVW